MQKPLSPHRNQSMTPMEKRALTVKQQAVLGLVALAIVMWIVLFLPAGSLNYWQGWVYWTVFSVSVAAISVYFIKKDISLIAKRVKAGPAAEMQVSQKIIQAVAALCFILLLLIPPLDFRFQWSNVPVYIVILADIFVAVGLAVVFFVFRENTFTSAVIEVDENQKVISTGPYKFVRHPMYSGALLMLFFTPLALGSFWGLIAFIPMLIAIGFRLVEEEKFLAKSLTGYTAYCQKTRFRLIPYVW
jgi:protein-S-isoprenylcysteine O-methyltransferase Ste14